MSQPAERVIVKGQHRFYPANAWEGSPLIPTFSAKRPPACSCFKSFSGARLYTAVVTYRTSRSGPPNSHEEEVLLSELILVELYRLLRNPAVVSKPLSASEATEVIQIWRQHPRWKITGFPLRSPELHNRLWKVAAGSAFGYRRIYDARLALTLLQYGVTEFATVNVKNFKEFGFRRVWNPLAE